MYNPAAFREERVPVLHGAIRQLAFGTLVTSGADGIEASPIPMVLDATQGTLGTLFGHLARGNPQWRAVSAGSQALAIFLGPHAYITPSWYETKQRTGEVVPTWNYLAVQARGTIDFYDDPVELRAHVEALTDSHEAKRAQPWAVSDAPEPFIEKMLRGIVGFRLTITRLEGKWKMSQNRPEADRAGVVDGLTAEGDERQRSVAAIVGDRGGSGQKP